MLSDTAGSNLAHTEQKTNLRNGIKCILVFVTHWFCCLNTYDHDSFVHNGNRCCIDTYCKKAKQDQWAPWVKGPFDSILYKNTKSQQTSSQHICF